MKNVLSRGVGPGPQRLLAAMAEPTRFRIVGLLAASPRTVGEVATALDLRQPQATKHLQALEEVGMVTVYRLGRRRVIALDRAVVRELAGWLGGLAEEHPSEAVLAEYEAAVAAEDARAAAGMSQDRTLELRREVIAPADRVWPAWTTPAEARRWWAPQHFEVAELELDARAGGALRLVLREADGATYTATGTFLELRRPESLRFAMSPLAADGTPLFDAEYAVRLAPAEDRTLVTVTIGITGVAPGASAAVAGVEIGWRQQLDGLAALLA